MNGKSETVPTDLNNYVMDFKILPKIKEVSDAAAAYIQAKSEQTMVLHTTRRESRLAFAEKLKNWAARTADSMTNTKLTAEQGKNEKRLLNMSDTDIKRPEFLDIENRGLTKEKASTNVERLIKNAAGLDGASLLKDYTKLLANNKTEQKERNGNAKKCCKIKDYGTLRTTVPRR